MARTGVLDAFLVYEFLKRLVLPFKEWDAFKRGVIDADGNILVPSTKRTSEQQDSFKIFDVLVRNLKRLLEKVPGGDTQFGSLTAAAILVKESRAPSFDWEDEFEVEKNYMKRLNEDGPTIAMGNSSVTGSPIAGADGKNGPARLGKGVLSRLKRRRRKMIFSERIITMRQQIQESQSVVMIANIMSMMDTITTQLSMIDYNGIVMHLGNMAPKDGQTAYMIGNESIKRIRQAKRYLKKREVKKKIRARAAKKPVLAEDVYDVDPHDHWKSRHGKNRYHRFSRYIANQGDLDQIRGARRGSEVVLRDRSTGMHTVLRKGRR